MKGARGRGALWASGSVALVVAALVGVLVTRPAATTTAAQSPLVGKPAPGFGGTSLSGQRVSLAELRGRYALVNFFASWCGPCRTEEPELVTLAYQHRGPSGLAILAVAFNDTTDGARAFLRTYGAVWPALPDPDGVIALQYGVRGPPESFLVSPDGRVVAKFVGPVSAGEVDRYLARARAEQA